MGEYTNVADATLHTDQSRISVIIVSGFLGAGKTTFIQKLISPSLDREKTVILENEFGDVNFDGASLKQRGLSVVSVLSGCICCTGIGNFTGSIQEAAEQFSPQRIVIEPTGVAKLSELLALFEKPPLSDLCDVKQAITVVDVRNFNDLHYLTEDFYENQISSSDVAILSKIEGLDQDTIDDVTRRIYQIAPHILIVDRPWEDLSEDERETCQNYRSVQGKGTCDHCCGHGHANHGHDHNHEDHEHEHEAHDHEGHEHNHDHDQSHAFVAYSFQPICSAEFLRENADRLSGGDFGHVLRVKGFLRGAGGSLKQIDYVPGELRMTEAADAFQDENARVVFIGAGLKERTIAEFLNSPYRDETK